MVCSEPHQNGSVLRQIHIIKWSQHKPKQRCSYPGWHKVMAQLLCPSYLSASSSVPVTRFATPRLSCVFYMVILLSDFGLCPKFSQYRARSFFLHPVMVPLVTQIFSERAFLVHRSDRASVTGTHCSLTAVWMSRLLVC